MPRASRRADTLWKIVPFTVAAFSAALACTPDSPDPVASGPSPVASLLAVGDTGQQWRALPWFREGQLTVGAAMQREHARAPVDALVLLGDNLYGDSEDMAVMEA